MHVSRKDIIHDRILDYPVDERFLKLPVTGYLDLLGISPNAPQTAIINAINNPKYRFICAAVSRRTGKTYIANVIAQLVALVPGSQVLIISPNYSLSQISFDLQRQLIRHFDLEVRRDNAKDKIIELENDSVIRMGSVGQIDSVIGRSYNFIIFDEAAVARDAEAGFNVQLRPTLDLYDQFGHSASKVLFISTPRGKNNWFAKFYNYGFTTEFPEWASIHATYKDNPRATDEDIDSAIRGMSDAEFRQEYLADFNVFEGQIFKFDASSCVQDLSSLDTRNMDIIAGLDVGVRDPTAFCVIAYDWSTENYYILEDYLDNEQTTATHAGRVREMINKYGIDIIYIDSANQQMRMDFAQEHDIPTNNAKKDRDAGIGFVQNIVEKNRLVVDQNCFHVLESLDQYRWDPNPNLITQKPVHDEYCHMADAIRYALYSFVTNALTF